MNAFADCVGIRGCRFAECERELPSRRATSGKINRRATGCRATGQRETWIVRLIGARARRVETVDTRDIAFNLSSEPVRRAYPADPLSISPDTSVLAALRLLKEQRTGSVLVCDTDGKLVGIFTERDVLRLMAKGADPESPVEPYMSAPPVTIATDATVSEAIQKMSRGGYRRLPMVDGDGRPTGTVKVSGIVHYLVEHFPSTVYNLPPVPDQQQQQREGG